MFVELGDTRFDVTTRALVMGILNRTPDSFFDGGRYWEFDGFLRQAELLVDQGADFLDVGGVKAGPGPEVTPTEEVDRVVPAVEALRERFDLPVSVDTFRASVLDESLKAGAVVGNDISGFADPDYLSVAVRHGASVVATHVRIGPRIADPQPRYRNVRTEVAEFLRTRAEAALAAGIDRRRIMVDAGLDLGKTPAMSAELIRHSDDLVRLGFTVFLSASNKGFLGELTGTTVDDRTHVTLGAHALGIALGCRVLRAHDVARSRRVADMMSALLQNRRTDLSGATDLTGPVARAQRNGS
ncbi:MAG: dihydropteroate synthase [Acidimicrobiaceae bacterium]|nr:dihydropteroate synthase [Acidimicrobiia bacterium]MCY4492782.1 dihydropteroate synthase [Acidimicrobiaceae bacterium]